MAGSRLTVVILEFVGMSDVHEGEHERDARESKEEFIHNCVSVEDRMLVSKICLLVLLYFSEIISASNCPPRPCRRLFIGADER